jgi:hypothetical protein
MPVRGGLDLLWEGTAARAYAATFGKWLKVTSVYSMLYATDAKPNTGRVSVAISELLKEGFVATIKHPSTTWKLYTATFKPILLDAKSFGVEFSDQESKLLSDFYGCAGDVPVDSAAGGLIEFSKDGFLPPLCQARLVAGSVVGLSLAYFSSGALEGRRMSQYLSALRGALDGQPGSSAINSFGSLATKISLQARTEVGNSKPVESTLLYRLAKYSGHNGALSEIIETVKVGT